MINQNFRWWIFWKLQLYFQITYIFLRLKLKHLLDYGDLYPTETKMVEEGNILKHKFDKNPNLWVLSKAITSYPKRKFLRQPLISLNSSGSMFIMDECSRENFTNKDNIFQKVYKCSLRIFKNLTRWILLFIRNSLEIF